MPNQFVLYRDIVAVDEGWWEGQQASIRRAIELCKEAKKLCVEDYGQEPLDMETAINLLHRKIKELRELLNDCEIPF
jgi:hypothetical protein